MTAMFQAHALIPGDKIMIGKRKATVTTHPQPDTGEILITWNNGQVTVMAGGNRLIVVTEAAARPTR